MRVCVVIYDNLMYVSIYAGELKTLATMLENTLMLG